MITKLNHANIIVSNLDRSRRFYTEILGLEILMETDIDEAQFASGVGIPGAKVRGIFLQVPGTPTVIEMFEYTGPQKSKPIPKDWLPSDIGVGHIAFEVNDLDAAYEKLRTQGVSFVSSPVTIPSSHKDVGGVRFCYFKDPDDTILELIYFPQKNEG
jgi:catechol 2,3-dioxygenase-like lactoylglutathione lyase family enzyme